ncbi:MAG TPA: SET domain-containing protein-lysine N-methyltransferase [Granulicella sp.]
MPRSLPSGLIIRSSSIHAAGCYTTQPIRKGTRICEYDGPRMTKEAADLRYEGRFVTYLFGYGDGDMVIDGFGTAMFINHSCAPNCETEDDQERIFITAIRDITAGEELTYEYHLYDSDDEEDDGACYCGAPNCRGTMFSDLELERRAKLAKKQSRKKTK